MAVLDDTTRAGIVAEIMRQLSREAESVAITKPELRAAVDALDSFLDTNATAINNAFPAAARNGLTTGQKARLLAWVTLKRWGGQL